MEFYPRSSLLYRAVKSFLLKKHQGLLLIFQIPSKAEEGGGWRDLGAGRNSHLVGPGHQQDFGSLVLGVSRGLDQDGLHGDGAVREVLH